MYLWDVAENGGCAAVVPGSHLLGDAPSISLATKHASGYSLAKEEGALDHDKMPNHVKIAVKAGTFMCFDTAIWHTALANSSDRPRCCVTLGWESSRMKAGEPAISSECAARLAKAGRLPLSRRRLFGLPHTGLPAQAIGRSHAAMQQTQAPSNS